MLLDEANDFSCATTNDVAFKMLYLLPNSFKILKGFFAFKIHAFLVLRTFEIPFRVIVFKILFYEV